MSDAKNRDEGDRIGHSATDGVTVGKVDTLWFEDLNVAAMTGQIGLCRKAYVTCRKSSGGKGYQFTCMSNAIK